MGLLESPGKESVGYETGEPMAHWGSQPAWASETLETPQQVSDTDQTTFWSSRSAMVRFIKLHPLGCRVEPNCEASDPTAHQAVLPERDFGLGEGDLLSPK